ncbi:MAG: triose-phosphate isomerase [Gammaproteobacteria bacterium]|nr:triose-phosphate isomerase [Gammaproteobacteria bacterium]
MTRRKLVAGNWKMNGSPQSVDKLVTELCDLPLSELESTVVICPPALFVSQVMSQASIKMVVGGQNCSDKIEGALTGEISPRMLKQLGCEYVILGHSERRQVFSESDELIANKVDTAIKEGLTPILCVGESLEQREKDETSSVIRAQLDAVKQVIGIDSFAKVVIAYEPIWAIGTGKTASPEQAQEVHADIRQWMASSDESIAASVTILYGGSVKSSNAAELFAQNDIDGGLIGGASLDSQEFFKICQSAG